MPVEFTCLLSLTRLHQHLHCAGLHASQFLCERWAIPEFLQSTDVRQPPCTVMHHPLQTMEPFGGGWNAHWIEDQLAAAYQETGNAIAAAFTPVDMQSRFRGVRRPSLAWVDYNAHRSQDARCGPHFKHWDLESTHLRTAMLVCSRARIHVAGLQWLFIAGIDCVAIRMLHVSCNSGLMLPCISQGIA